MINKKILFSLGFMGTFSLMPLGVISCVWHQNDDHLNITKESYKFYNLSSHHKIYSKSANLYFKENENIPYVSISEMINMLDGFLESSYISKLTSSFFNQKTYYWDNYKFTVNWKTNKMFVNNLGFFRFTKSSSTTDYSKHLKYISYNVHKTKDFKKTIEFNLEKYGLDILNYRDKLLIPLPVFNTLFCSQNYYNLYFNGENLYGAYFDLDDRTPNINKIKSGGFENKLQSLVDRKNTLGHLLWTLDHFYGLKDHKGISKFSDYLSDEDKNKILSTNPNSNNEAYAKLFYNKLNDLHTWMSMLSFYNDANTKVSSLNTMSSNSEQYRKILSKLIDLRKRRFYYGNVPPVRFVGNTAIISFDEFKTGTKNELAEPDAYKYDTYELMKYAMKEIKEYSMRNTPIKNIVVDLSLNGGGNVAAMYRALGFLTKKPIEDYDYNTLSKTISERKFRVDTDGNGRYNNLDGYPEYKWNVLVGKNTFSAANLFTAIAKYTNLARIIGQQSGGGECSVMPNVMADGTSYVISSNNASRILNGNDHYQSIESGIDPHKWMSYDDFYDDNKIWELVNN
ncbi:S41 family peptidase [Metamycoplasma buccale]|uniref:S41 family peptidase n=1 Tax=Metamycoplasma buccale TaxID=55602 RepID=UPI00398E5519